MLACNCKRARSQWSCCLWKPPNMDWNRLFCYIKTFSNKFWLGSNLNIILIIVRFNLYLQLWTDIGVKQNEQPCNIKSCAVFKSPVSTPLTTLRSFVKTPSWTFFLIQEVEIIKKKNPTTNKRLCDVIRIEVKDDTCNSFFCWEVKWPIKMEE